MSGGDDRTKGKCLVPKWLAWLTGLLLIVAIVLAIVLPLTLVKDEDCTPYVYRTKRAVVQPFDSVKYEDPFDAYEVPSEVRSLFNSMPQDQKYSQAQQWSFGDASGLPLTNLQKEDMVDLARNKEVGSFLNVVDREWVKEIQDAAYEDDPKIPVLFGFDVIHGHHTMFPVNIGIAATFSRELVYESSAIAAKEAAAEGITWTFAPMLDIARDPRWGRISESFGEDAYLTGELGVAFTKGFQDNGVAACVKHVAAYGAGQAGRDYHTAQLGRAYVHNDYLPAYRKAFDAGAWTAMASFNTIEGVPSHANRELLTDVLRGMWGWDGMIVADYGGIRELIPHGVANTTTDKYYEDAAKAAMVAGVDMSMADSFFYNGLKGVAKDKDELERTVDNYVDLANKRILAVKHALNLFEKPYGPLSDEEYRNFERCSTQSLAVARETSEASMVLLKNDDTTLPIELPETVPGNKKKIVVMGRTANSKPDMLGFWNGRGQDCCDKIIPFYQGIEQKFGEKFDVSQPDPNDPNATVDLVLYGEVDDSNHNCPRTSRQFKGLNAVGVQNLEADYIIYVAGEGYLEHGEASSKTDINLPDLAHVKLVAENRPVGTKFILVIIGGRQFSIEWEEMTQLTDSNGGNPRPAVDAIIQAWSPGTMGGPALANLLSGEIDFSGKMPVTTPRNVGQCPIYYSQLPTGRPAHTCRQGGCETRMWPERDYKWFVSAYMDSWTTPLYPFGYGLSYAEYTYANPRVNGQTSVEVTQDADLTVTVQVSSNVDRATYEVVQLYVKQLIGGEYISPPQKLLKGFERVEVPAEGTVTVTFTLNVWEDFGFYNNDLKWGVTPGEFKIYLAKNSDDTENELTVTVRPPADPESVAINAN